MSRSRTGECTEPSVCRWLSRASERIGLGLGRVTCSETHGWSFTSQLTLLFEQCSEHLITLSWWLYMSELFLLFRLLLLLLLSSVVHTSHQSLDLLHHHLHLLLSIWHLLDCSPVCCQELHDVRDLHHLLLILKRGWSIAHLRETRGCGLSSWSLHLCLCLLGLLFHESCSEGILRCLA